MGIPFRIALLLFIFGAYCASCTDDCQNLEAAVDDGGKIDESPIFLALWNVDSGEEQEQADDFAISLSDYIHGESDARKKLKEVKRMTEEFIRGRPTSSTLGDKILAAIVTFGGTEQRNLTLHNFFNCIEINGLSPVVTESVAGTIPLSNAVSEACTSANCTRADKTALSTLSSSLYVQIEELSSSAEKLKKAMVLLNWFMLRNTDNVALEEALKSAIIPGYEASIESFLLAVSQIELPTTQGSPTTTTTPDKCIQAPGLVDDHGKLDSSIIFLALERACVAKRCLPADMSKLWTVSFYVSDCIRTSIGQMSNEELIVNVTETIQSFLEDLEETSVVKKEVLEANLSNWGTMAEFLQCDKYARCTAVVQHVLYASSLDEWCILLEAVEMCDGCTRTDRVTSSSIAQEILLRMYGNTVEEKSAIAAKALKTFFSSSTGTANEAVAKKIYETTLSGSVNVGAFVNCVLGE